MAAETDNYASALWLSSFAGAFSLFSQQLPCFRVLAKNIQLVRCLKCNASSPIPRKNGQKRQTRIRTNLPPDPERLNLRTNLVRQGHRMAGHKYLTSPPNLTGMPPGVP